MKRQDVYERINEERNFQESLAKTIFRHNAADKSVPAEIMMMQVYLNKAIHSFTNNYGDQPALHQIRKVVALGVRCLENHGCPKREKLANLADVGGGRVDPI